MHARSGFTLIELILVLVILSLGAAVAVPSLSGFTRRRQAADAAGHMLAVMQFAQDRAASTGSPQRVQIDPVTGTYWLTARRDGVFTRLSEEYGRTFTLPDTVKMSWDATNDVTARGYLEFDPDGGHDMAVIHVIARDGTETLIGCASPSEPYRIGTPGVDVEVR